ncbi:methyl-accepting chemotaxis protein [Paenibacillus sp. yr247]|uniref:methyl-accepting chemotaxis protein n=1 Tax=Paenibacillus sp. yr247 TaxID=1761880 RepID=UPI00088FFE15|nr:methyl-accepting chemotaxis protein [Paenibacillus sp. yr247]SDO16516.1 methyl-accepting chemotaxis protein [Paenibacillus sp. yr247]
MFKNIKISMKILILITVSVLSLVVVGLFNWTVMNQMNKNTTDMYQNSLLPVKWINNIRSNYHEQDSYILELMINTDNNLNQTFVGETTNLEGQSDYLLSNYKKTSLTPDELEKTKELTDITQKIQVERKKVVELAAQNKNQEAYANYVKILSPLDQQRHIILQKISSLSEQKALDLNNSNIKNAVTTRMIFIIIFVISLLVCMAIGYWIIRLITRPIRVMQRLMENAASGDLTVHGDYVSKDEIGSLTHSFNAMIDGLRNLMKNISENSLSLSAMSEELSASAEQAGQAATHITESIQEVSAGTEKQLENVQTTEETIGQMSIGINQISNYSQRISEKAFLASESAIDGKQAIKQSVVQMNVIQSSVSNASRSITELGEETENIGTIVEFISDIAGQTNLLALNAAIEAARVGEQGKGFTVVANEVRKLSEQTSNAVSKISDFIESIQSKVKASVADMEVGTKEVAEGTVVINAVNKSFDKIYNVIGEVTSEIQEISSSVQRIAVGTEEVVKSFQIVSEIASVSAAETQTVSAATEEQLASTEEIAASANSLSNMAEDLQSYVSHFKV